MNESELREASEHRRARARGGTFSVSWGDYGGFYWRSQDGMRRVCLGWVAVTLWPYDLDYMLRESLKEKA